MLALAGPVVLAEIGWVSMGIVDTLMVGRLSAEAIGAVGIGSHLFLALAVFGIGLLLGLDTLVSQAFGAGRVDECHRWLFHGIWLSAVLTVPLTLLARAGVWSLPFWGLHPDVLVLTVPYLEIISWSVLPLLLYASFRRYLQAMSVVRPIMFALVSANVINAVANWVLVFGNLGAPALGVDGAGWATCISRVYMAAVLLAAILRHDARAGTRLFETPIGLEGWRLARLVRLGFPAAGQVTLEIGVFAAATVLAGRFPPAAVAAHQIALNLASFTFMVPLGVSSAGAVRVGHAIGRRDSAGASRAGWTALVLGTLFMSAASLAFLTMPALLVRAFTPEPAVIATGISLLFVAAIFQLFDGLQGVATGVLRGLGDTKTPMLWNLAGHWALGLPLGYLLAFSFGWGVLGLWVGLSSGLILVGTVLVVVWARRSRALGVLIAFEPPSPAGRM
jgi:multidrug resistance protein, MATE family